MNKNNDFDNKQEIDHLANELGFDWFEIHILRNCHKKKTWSNHDTKKPLGAKTFLNQCLLNINLWLVSYATNAIKIN